MAATRGGRWARLEAELAELLAAEGIELVELRVVTGRQRMMEAGVDWLERPGTITIDECATVSRRISRWLEQVDPFDGPYRLLVSSPGVDRPLPTLESCRRAVGLNVKVTRLREGRRESVVARLVEVTDDSLRLEVEGATEATAWTDVVRANVVHDWGDWA